MTALVHTTVVWICAAAALATVAVLLGSVAVFRGESARSRSRTAEILWALIPVAILAGAALPAVKTLALGEQPAELVATGLD